MTEDKTYYAIAFSRGNSDLIEVFYNNNQCSDLYYSSCKRFEGVDRYESKEEAYSKLNEHRERYNKYMQEKGFSIGDTPRTYFLMKVKEIIESTVIGYERIDEENEQ